MGRAGALASGLSEEFPARIAGESMLGKFGSSFVVGSGAEYLRTKSKAVSMNGLIIYGGQVAGEMRSRTYREDDGDAAANRLRAVQLGRLAHPELLLARGRFPAEDGSAKK